MRCPIYKNSCRYLQLSTLNCLHKKSFQLDLLIIIYVQNIYLYQIIIILDAGLQGYVLWYDCGVTRRASARCGEDYEFLSQPNTASYLKTLKMVPTAAMCQLRYKNIYSYKNSRMNALAKNKSNSFPWTVFIRSKGCVIKVLDVCRTFYLLANKCLYVILTKWQHR